MITKRTVFILGAGASMPFGFPSGATLVEEILEKGEESVDAYGRRLRWTTCPPALCVTHKSLFCKKGREMKRIITLSVVALSLILMGGGCTTPHLAKGETVIALDATGAVSVDGRPTPLSDLPQALTNLGVSTSMPIMIRADKRTAYDHVVGVLNELKTLGYTNVSFATKQ